MATNQQGKWLILATLSLLLLIGLFIRISEASQSPRVCTVPEPFKSIQTAIDDPTCDHISIGEGEYLENLVIRRSLFVEGVGPQHTRIRGWQFDAPVIRIASDGQEIYIALKGLSILEARGNSQDDGIQIYGKSHVVLEQVHMKQNRWGVGILIRDEVQAFLRQVMISENGQGIQVADNAQVRLLQAQVVNNGGSGGLVVLGSARVEIADSIFRGNGGSSFGAIVAFDSAYVALTGTVLVSNGQGMSLEHKASADLVESFIVSNVGTGVTFVSQGHLAVRHSEIVGNAKGIASYSGSIMVENSKIANNSETGFSLHEKSQAIIASTIISGNGLTGITLSGFSRAKVKQASISENGYRGAPWPFFGGIIMESESQLTLEESLISANAGWGLAQFIKACFPEFPSPVSMPDKFSGAVNGTPTNRFFANGRLLPSETKSNGDGIGDVCPKELSFLKGY